MAWYRGDLITAAKLDSENVAYNNAHPVKYSGNNGYKSPWMYVRCNGKSRKIFHYYISCDKGFLGIGSGFMNLTLCHDTQLGKPGEYAGIDRTIDNISNGGTSSRDFSVSEDGWYRLEGSGQKNYLEVTYYPAMTNNIRGDYLGYFDDPFNSGNLITGKPLTVENLSSGRVGTYPGVAQ